jgi:hypothetical protein
MQWSEEDFTELGNTIDTTPDEEFRRVVRAAVGDYWLGKLIIAETPRPSQQRAALIESLKHAEKLAVCMNDLDEETRDIVKAAWDAIVHPLLFKENAIRDLGGVPVFTNWRGKRPDGKGNVYAAWYNAVAETTALVVQALRDALEVMNRDPGGPNKRWVALNQCLPPLKGLYRVRLGLDPSVAFDAYKELYSGSFFEFIKSFLAKTDPDFRPTNHALGEALRRCLDLRS